MKSARWIGFQKVQALGLCGNLRNARTFKPVCFQFGKSATGQKGHSTNWQVAGPNSLLMPAHIRYLGFHQIATLASSPPSGLQLGASPPLTQDRVVRAPHEPTRRVVESPPLQSKLGHNRNDSSALSRINRFAQFGFQVSREGPNCLVDGSHLARLIENY